jgi:L-2-hydroxyglutarate oxidase LhgO
MNNYDLVIIGGGPAGLALAQCICQLNKKILIIEKEYQIGGCHRVRRVNNLFTEHGPRIYSNVYLNFRNLLKEMNIDFYDIFNKYKFSHTEIGGETVFSTLTFGELFQLTIEFIKLLFNNSYGFDIILQDFLYKNNYKKESIDMIDRICKLTDGGGIDKYTLGQFLELFNQNFFYSLYHPKLPNDIGLFKSWKNFLEKKGVTFMLNTTVEKININTQNNTIQSINAFNYGKSYNIFSNKFVFAMPPKNLYQLINKFNIPHDWGNLREYAFKTAYIDYISVTFHWDKPLKLNKVYGFPRSSWGLAFVVLTDYMKFNENNSKTVISTAVTLTDKKSPNINKTADQCNLNELINEMFLQLKEAYPNLPKPTYSIISPGIIYNNQNKKWESIDTAFILTANFPSLKFQNNSIKNMYTLGTHNGYSNYKFTSLESAVTNSIVLSKKLYPELNDPKYIQLSRGTSLTDIFRITIKIVILLILIYLLFIR